ncbi:MAG: 4Fe-4S binding protein, partial [Chloroflexota bacterium]
MSAGKQGTVEGAEAGVRPAVAEPVAVYAKWCKGCGICIEFCPTKALRMGKDGRPVVDAAVCNL